MDLINRKKHKDFGFLSRAEPSILCHRLEKTKLKFKICPRSCMSYTLELISLRLTHYYLCSYFVFQNCPTGVKASTVTSRIPIFFLFPPPKYLIPRSTRIDLPLWTDHQRQGATANSFQTITSLISSHRFLKDEDVLVERRRKQTTAVGTNVAAAHYVRPY